MISYISIILTLQLFAPIPHPRTNGEEIVNVYFIVNTETDIQSKQLKRELTQSWVTEKTNVPQHALEAFKMEHIRTNLKLDKLVFIEYHNWKDYLKYRVLGDPDPVAMRIADSGQFEQFPKQAFMSSGLPLLTLQTILYSRFEFPGKVDDWMIVRDRLIIDYEIDCSQWARRMMEEGGLCYSQIVEYNPTCSDDEYWFRWHGQKLVSTEYLFDDEYYYRPPAFDLLKVQQNFPFDSLPQFPTLPDKPTVEWPWVTFKEEK